MSVNDVLITVSSPTQFTVLQPPPKHFIGPFISLIVLLIVGVFFYRHPNRKLGIVVAILAISFLVSLIPDTTSYQLFADAQQHMVRATKLHKGQSEAQWEAPLNDISQVTMQYNRGAVRVALILRDGRQLVPFSGGYAQDEPGLFKVQIMLEQLLRDGKLDPKTASSPPPEHNP